jgi:hypothetical protein
MARIKKGSLKQHDKILTIMLDGQPVAIKQIETLLGKEIEMYRISAYMLGIKYDYKGVIKTQKNGRNVLSYQLVNADEVKIEFEKRYPQAAKQTITKLDDLNAKPKKVTKPKKEKVVEELKVEEITEE